MLQLSRRGLIGMLAAGVGAVIVRPGLIMPIKPAKFFTLADWVEMQHRIVYPPYLQRIAKLLSDSNNLLNDLPWVEGVPLTTITIRTPISVAQWRAAISA